MNGNNEQIDNGVVPTKEKNVIRSVLHCPYYWDVMEIEHFRNGTKVEMDQEMRHLVEHQHVHNPKPVMVDGELVEQNSDEEIWFFVISGGNN